LGDKRFEVASFATVAKSLGKRKKKTFRECDKVGKNARSVGVSGEKEMDLEKMQRKSQPRRQSTTAETRIGRTSRGRLGLFGVRVGGGRRSL